MSKDRIRSRIQVRIGQQVADSSGSELFRNTGKKPKAQYRYQKMKGNVPNMFFTYFPCVKVKEKYFKNC